MIRANWFFVAVVLSTGLGCAGFFQEKKNARDDTYIARKRLARELIARQDWSTAFAYADDMRRERPKDAEILVLRGVIYRERGLPGEAEADLKQALKMDRNLAEAHAALGILYDLTMRGEMAESQHRQANTLAPNSPGYLNNLGFSLFLRKKNQEAIETFQKAIRLDPTNNKIRTNLGFAYASAGDLPRASKAFEMSGSPAEARNNIGFAYEKRGDLKNAYDQYAEAVRLEPKFKRARRNLAHAAKKLGKEIPPDLIVVQPEPVPEKEGIP